MEQAEGIDLGIVEGAIVKRGLENSILTLETSLDTLKGVMKHMSASEMRRHAQRLLEIAKIIDSVVENQKVKCNA